MSAKPDLAAPLHTVALVALIVSVALAGSLLAHSGAAPSAVRAPPSAAARYFPLLLVNGLLVFYVSRAFRPRNELPSLLGAGWSGARRAAIDLGLAVGLALSIVGLETLFIVRASRRNAAVSALLPHTGAERLAWLVVAVCVGFAEEVVYRGYLRTQLAAFTRSRVAGVLLQAALFGLAHLESGVPGALRAAGYGVLFGLVAELRGSLLPGILAHACIDLAAGWLR